MSCAASQVRPRHPLSAVSKRQSLLQLLHLLAMAPPHLPSPQPLLSLLQAMVMLMLSRPTMALATELPLAPELLTTAMEPALAHKLPTTPAAAASQLLPQPAAALPQSNLLAMLTPPFHPGQQAVAIPPSPPGRQALATPPFLLASQQRQTLAATHDLLAMGKQGQQPLLHQLMMNLLSTGS